MKRMRATFCMTALALAVSLCPLMLVARPAARAYRPSAVRQPLTGAAAKLWRDSGVEDVSDAIMDGDEKTFVILTPEKRDSRLGVGLQWPLPEKIDALRVTYATLNGTVYDVLPDSQFLEFWDGNQWRSLDCTVQIDYREEGKFAPYQKSGLVSWDYRFDSVQAQGIRLILHKTPSPIRWDQHYVIREMKPYFSAGSRPQKAKFVVLGRPKRNGELTTNLAASETGAVRSQDAEGTVVSWSRETLIDELLLMRKELPGPVQWWDGLQWREIQIVRVETPSSGSPSLVASFLPLAVKKLRLVGLPASAPLQIRLGQSARQYFDRVYHSGPDMLMERILGSRDEPDLASVASLLLPLDMHTSVIGRPGDGVECMVHWNGTMVEIEQGDRGAWNTGAKEIVPGKEEWIDRWFAFAANNELFGTDVNSTVRSYLDGYLPAALTRYSKDGIQFELEAFTTMPGDSVYANLVTVRVTNPGKQTKQASFSVLMGLRPSARAGHRRASTGKAPSPMNFQPANTSYRLEGNGKKVTKDSGEIVLYAKTPGQWGGTPVENILSYPLQLKPGQTRQIHFIFPSVNTVLKDHSLLEDLNVEKSREGFRKYWRKVLEEQAGLDLPEKPLNDLYKNLLAQCMIILMDGHKLKYGAYWYESYFGLEEGWPIVALAQFGRGEEAMQSIKLMLSPELMDKSNYHHQYRSGLAPMYAAQVSRLIRDRTWLQQIKARLIETADWIMKARHQKEGKPEEFYGLLPRHAYGGDIGTPAYSLYSNATCWRGLQDIGLLMRDLGENLLADKYLSDAQDYRKTIHQFVERTANQEVSPPFVPLAAEIGNPQSKDYKKVETPYPFIPSDPLGNYWILFAPLLLETGIFAADSTPAQWITSYMEQNGGLLAGLARFYRGVDHIYGFGYPLQLYERAEHKKFLASLYSILAHGHSRDNYTSPEVGGVFPLRTDNVAFQERFREYQWKWDLYHRGWMEEDFGRSVGSEPLSAGAGMALQLIRKLVLNEELDAEARPTGTLDLLKMAPARWLEDGKRIVIQQMPSFFGEINLTLHSELARGIISGRFEAPPGSSLTKTVLWLRHPDGRQIRSVKLNERGWSDFKSDSLMLPVSGVSEFEVRF